MGFALAVSLTAAAATEPTLGLVDRQPLIVSGAGFRDGETVRVTVLTGLGPEFKRVTAVNGRFRVMFRLPQAGCGAAHGVVARGSAGSRAFVEVAESSLCVPPPRR